MLPRLMILADVIYGQTFQVPDIFTVGMLIVLEGALSVDNALVLGLLAKRLAPHQRKKALTYGLVGAFVFRFAAIAGVVWLLKYPVVKLVGGAYLLYVAIKHFVSERPHDDEVKIGPDGHPIIEDLTPAEREAEIAQRLPIPEALDPSAPKPAAPVSLARAYAGFWPTVMVIELTDIAFAVDSIVAAVAFVPQHTGPGPNPKLWVVIAGGFFGVILMRFAAMIFVKLLDRFPRFEVAAYLLVAIIGSKLVFDWAAHSVFHWTWVDFHHPNNPAFWGFWTLMLGAFALGFLGRKKDQPA